MRTGDLSSDSANYDHVTRSRAYYIRQFFKQRNLRINSVRPAISEHLGAVAPLQNEAPGRACEGHEAARQVADLGCRYEGGEFADLEERRCDIS